MMEPGSLMSAAYNASPEKQIYFVLTANPIVQADASTVYAMVTVEYISVFSDPVKLAQS